MALVLDYGFDEEITTAGTLFLAIGELKTYDNKKETYCVENYEGNRILLTKSELEVWVTLTQRAMTFPELFVEVTLSEQSLDDVLTILSDMGVILTCKRNSNSIAKQTIYAHTMFRKLPVLNTKERKETLKKMGKSSSEIRQIMAESVQDTQLTKDENEVLGLIKTSSNYAAIMVNWGMQMVSDGRIASYDDVPSEELKERTIKTIESLLYKEMIYPERAVGFSLIAAGK